MSATYLEVPYREKDQAKALGAKFDGSLKSWYVPEGRDLAPFAKWLPAGAVAAPAQCEFAVDTAPAKGVRLASLMSAVSALVADKYAGAIWVQAEVLRVSQQPNGNVFLELVDGEAKARGVLWSDVAQRVVPHFEKTSGMVLGPNLKLLVQARVNFHAQYGFGLQIVDIDPEYSLGDLEARRREILRTLTEEGVVQANRKLPSPLDFEVVLVVAPAGAAGAGDFDAEARLLEQLGICRFIRVNARFQGEGAAGEIQSALDRALGDWEGQSPAAVVVIRGGGAVNDLAWLNDLSLTRYLAILPIPVITGIGHERDRTTLDEVAHQRCDTPSKAIAHIFNVIRSRTQEAARNYRDIVEAGTGIAASRRQLVDRQFQMIDQAARSSVSDARLNVQRHFSAVREGAARLPQVAASEVSKFMVNIRHDAQQSSMELKEELTNDLNDVRQRALEAIAWQRSSVDVRMRQIHAVADTQVAVTRKSIESDIQDVVTLPGRIAAAAREECHALFREIDQAARAAVRQGRSDIESNFGTIRHHAATTLGWARTAIEGPMNEVLAQGPEKSLKRGFAIVKDRDGRAITRAAKLSAGQPIRIQFHDGEAQGTISAKEEP
jgi:exodeoxyribonuclease VII large subunit